MTARGRRGSILLEFGLIAPVLMALMMTVLEGAWQALTAANSQRSPAPPCSARPVASSSSASTAARSTGPGGRRGAAGEVVGAGGMGGAEGRSRDCRRCTPHAFRPRPPGPAGQNRK